MITHTLNVPNVGMIKIHHNSDWSGDAIVMWPSPAGPISDPNGLTWRSADVPGDILRPLVNEAGDAGWLDLFGLTPPLNELAWASIGVIKEGGGPDEITPLIHQALNRIYAALSGRKILIQLLKDDNP